MNCNGTTPTFIPGPTDPVIPPSGLPTAASSGAPAGASPTSPASGGKGSAGAVSYLPWTTEVMGALAVAAAVGAAFL